VLLLVVLTVLAGSTITIVGLLGTHERLPRNRFAGVRTAATLRDEETFRLANRIAGLPMVVGGLVGVVAGIAAVLGGGLLVGGVGLAGMLAITVGGGMLGHRAALAMPKPQPTVPAGCGACLCGNCEVRSTFARS
jgi:uncharacterized membrane protein